jgi:hypothetical protein
MYLSPFPPGVFSFFPELLLRYQVLTKQTETESALSPGTTEARTRCAISGSRTAPGSLRGEVVVTEV